MSTLVDKSVEPRAWPRAGPPESFWTRLRSGYERLAFNESYKRALPASLFDFAMTVRSGDRENAKQGRSTLRVRLGRERHELTVYLKRHYRLSAWSALRATSNPAGAYSPATVEARALALAATLRIAVPEVVAWGERLRHGRLQSFLMVKELTGRDELNLVAARLSRGWPADEFAKWKRAIVRELARVVARLHINNLFHKDMYLCHVFVGDGGSLDGANAVALIDLHRLARHRWTRLYWVVKDLAQLMFSTFGVAGINARDLLRFWKHYRRFAGLGRAGVLRRLIEAKAKRYARHNVRRRRRSA